ncbi:dihydropteroate synthase [Fulvivirgaceae bacterium BMA12]|uniref:dihydropteroate synthase n=1 Tax=Agaribacillus aureus TaxID=3051825 RepID=A0ABT8L495_9BACT|nr:dihydropteroate synthase [Fulvivirgaceae bacterium BMA12]
MNNTVFYKKKTWNLNGDIRRLDQPLVMGIINTTPDSFYNGSRQVTEIQVLSRVETMINEGVDIIDIGGYSSRPGAGDISVGDELKRVIPAIQAIANNFPDTILSVDTFRAEVAKAAVNEGAHIINDISGGAGDTNMFATVAAMGVPYILMHMRGDPHKMQQLTQYEDLVTDIINYFQERLELLKNLGVNDVILDPGFGFAKTLDQNYELLKKLNYFNILNLPILVGISRKSMIYKKLGCSAAEALNGTSVLHSIALMQGATILRAHDVKEAKEAILLFQEVFK